MRKFQGICFQYIGDSDGDPRFFVGADPEGHDIESLPPNMKMRLPPAHRSMSERTSLVDRVQGSSDASFCQGPSQELLSQKQRSNVWFLGARLP